MQAGKPHDIRIEWKVDGGYMRLVHRNPLADEDRHSLSLYSELGHAVDYYFVSGENLDDVIAGYRRLTGESQLLPRWAYGFWQSRERYHTQKELLDVLKEYRRRQIPIDNIVLDWFYWKEDSWGSHEFDGTRFADPKTMVDEVHALNARIMISVWPKFYPTTENYKELDALGHIYPHTIDTAQLDWVGPGYVSSFYDPYSAEARDVYWRQIREKLDVLGFDAWWMDATEPDLGSNADDDERKLRMTPTSLGPGAAFFNSYGLMNAMAVFEGRRSVDPDRRVMILTRSGFPGVQRYAAAVWSGDIVSTWNDMRDQIPAGLNMSLSGLANWTFDAGGFTPENRYSDAVVTEDDRAEWRELNTRWFQFGAFAPLFRAHGQFPET
jgi:alpha-D-xyloside xylohydrolase